MSSVLGGAEVKLFSVFLIDLPSTRFFRADEIFSLRENFLVRSAYGRLWRLLP